MCEMLNLFVPLAQPVMASLVRGLAFSRSGEIQKDFAELYRGRGTILCGSAGSCMCGFDDWPALYEAARDVLSRNRITELAALRFWSKDRYELASRVVDPDDPESCTPLVMGEVVVIRAEPPEKRRHRLV